MANKTKDTKEPKKPKLTPKDYDRWDGRIGITNIRFPSDNKGGKKNG